MKHSGMERIARLYRSVVVVWAGALVAGGGAARAELVFGVTDQRFVVSWDSASPGVLLSGSAVSGLQQNETVLGIDFRPATGQLYALGSSNRLYVLNTTTGAATMVGAGPFAIPITGSSHGFDFNPTIDRIRVVTNTNDNYVLNPNDGTVQLQATDVFYVTGDPNQGADPNVVHSSYTNSFAGATATQLFGVDTGLDVLVRQANNAGTLETAGGFGTDVTDIGGFDISGATGSAYLAIRDAMSSKSTFWTINLATGVATGGNEVGGGNVITALAVRPIPEPATAGLALAAFAMIGGTRYCRFTRGRN
jgi:hypothetical protein